MTKQTRQTEICWLNETDEYQVKLFIDGIYQKGADYITKDFIDAQWAVINMEAQPKPQEDFCKEAEKKHKPGLENTNWPIYDELGELIGWLELAKDASMPQVLCIQDQVYIQTKLSRLACSEEKKE